jgi:hypothetical protein
MARRADGTVRYSQRANRPRYFSGDQETRDVHPSKPSIELTSRGFILNHVEDSIIGLVESPPGDGHVAQVSVDVAKPIVNLRIGPSPLLYRRVGRKRGTSSSESLERANPLCSVYKKESSAEAILLASNPTPATWNFPRDFGAFLPRIVMLTRIAERISKRIASTRRNLSYRRILRALLADIGPAADGTARGFDIGLFAVASADSSQRRSDEDQPQMHALSIG